jgi:DNA modification methylase
MTDTIIHRKETFLDGRVILLHANSFELMRDWSLERPDHIISDPPYNAQTHNGSRTNRKKTTTRVESTGINFKPFSKEDVAELVRLSLQVSKVWTVYSCAWRQVGEYAEAVEKYATYPYMYCGKWHKPTPSLVITKNKAGKPDRPAPVGEDIFCFSDNRPEMEVNGTSPLFFSMDVDRGCKEHPTQKPDEFFGKILDKFVKPDQLILDPFMGSASNIRACISRGIRVIGIELSPNLSKPITALNDEKGDNPDYFELAVRRTQEAVNNLDATGFQTRNTPKGIKVAPANSMGML